MFQLSHKDLLELKFWIEEKARDNYDAERAKLPLYMKALGLPQRIPGWNVRDDVKVLEIGTGPYHGLLQYMQAVPGATPNAPQWTPLGLVAVDPLIDAYSACGLLEDRGAILLKSKPFEFFDWSSETFDAIISCNALDHGEMGFHLLLKISRLLKRGGLFFMHVHLRPTELLNLVHDHSLTLAQFDHALQDTRLETVERRLFRKDIDGNFCEAVVGVWRKR